MSRQFSEVMFLIYSRVYRKIHPKAIEASRLAAPRLWKGETADRVLFARLWLADMSRLYGIPRVRFDFVDDPVLYEESGGGRYIPNEHRIVLYHRWSFVTLAHEFRHAVQASGFLEAMYLNDPEEDARAWSVSLFRLSCPKSYKSAVANGRLHFA